MNHWIFTIKKQQANGSSLSARELYDVRVANRFWTFGPRTHNRKRLGRGDRVVFYVGWPDREFAGTATLAADSVELSSAQRKKYSNDPAARQAEYGVALDQADRWEPPVPVRDMVSDLSFVKNKERWWAHFQGGVRTIPEQDFATIARQRVNTDTWPGPDLYARALKEILDDLTDQQLLMLKAHFVAIDHTLTAEDMARAAGYRTYRPANLQYGRLGTRLREALGVAGQGAGQKSAILATFIEPDEVHRCGQWVMRPELSTALNKLGWFCQTEPVVEAAEIRQFAAQEGMLRIQLEHHRQREESLRQAKIAAALDSNPQRSLVCEVPGCRFDFEAQYGELGGRFAEVHHLNPLSQAGDGTTTQLDELSIVCSNCHRMIHRDGQCRPLEEIQPRLRWPSEA